MPKTGYHRKAYLRRPDNAPPGKTKSRHCLRCRASFESAWSGERVCAKCKASQVWRDGVGIDMGSWSRW